MNLLETFSRPLRTKTVDDDTPRARNLTSNRRSANAPVGLMLVNLGTPDAPTVSGIRRFLREFLSDTRVIELPRILWLPILYCFVLPFRPKRLVNDYRSIWLKEGSPLSVFNERLATSLQDKLAQGSRTDVHVRSAMRYGQPSIDRILKEFHDLGIQRVAAIPMFPQYSATTTAAVTDAIGSTLRRQRDVPELRWLRSYYNASAYIDALAATVREHWQTHGRGDRLLMSFHGIPERYAAAGDPYPDECQITAEMLAASLDMPAGDWAFAFQSRFGKAPWIKPYTDAMLVEWGQSGVGDIDVICPGFPADCLETLDEIACQEAENFAQAGGGQLRYIPALNARPEHNTLIESLARELTQSWVA